MIDELNDKKSISARKLRANRINAAKSSGPRTAIGKRRSAQNAYKHGVLSRELFPETEFGQREWAKFKDTAEDIYSEYQPEGIAERMLVDKLIADVVRRARLLGFEVAGLTDVAVFWHRNTGALLRYGTTIDRQLAKTQEQLRLLQAQRASAEEGTKPEQAGEEEDAPVDAATNNTVTEFCETNPPHTILHGEVQGTENLTDTVKGTLDDVSEEEYRARDEALGRPQTLGRSDLIGPDDPSDDELLECL